MLDGITLRTAIQLLEQEGIPVRRETIDRSMLYSSDELILTGTAAQIMHAESIDGRMLGNEKSAGAGPICSLLRCRFQEIIDGTYPYESPAIEKFTIPQPQNIQR